MSLSNYSWAERQRTDGPLDKLLLIRLAVSTGRDALVTLEPRALAAFADCGEEAVFSALNRLRERGLIVPTGDPVDVIYRLGVDDGWLARLSEEGLPNYVVKRVLPKALRLEVIARDGYLCKACGCADELQVDHIIPEKHGGSDDLSNLQTLCKSCNSSKGDRIYVFTVPPPVGGAT